MNTELFQMIDEVTDQAEINVLIAIGESYSKMLEIADAVEDEDVIQEFAIFMEASKLDGLKNLFIKAANFIKAGFNKITSMIEKRMVKDKRCLIMLGNMMLVANVLDGKPKKITESYVDNDSDDIYQEGLFKKTENEKKYNELVRAENKREKLFGKSLKKLVNDDIYHRRLSKEEINELVDILSTTMKQSDWNKFRDDIVKVSQSDGGQFAKDTFQNLAFIKYLSNDLKQLKYIREKAEIDRGVENAKEKFGETRVKMDIKLVEEFQNTLGNTFNKIAKTKTFSTHQCMSILYGDNRFKSLLKTLGQALFDLVEAVPKTIKEVKAESNNIFDFMMRTPNKIIDDIGAAGGQLYNAQHNFKDYMTRDKWSRDEANISLNKTVEGVMFALDNLKEETWGYQDDYVFNYQAYSNGNLVALNMGGPITMAVRLLFILGHAIAGDPNYIQTMSAPGEIGVGDILLSSQARLLSRGGAIKHTPLETESKQAKAAENAKAKSDYKETKKVAKNITKAEKEIAKQVVKNDKKKKAKVVKEAAEVKMTSGEIISICNDMLRTLHDFSYGMPDDTGVINNKFVDEDYDKMYKLLSPEDFVKYKGGICYDYVEYEDKYLTDAGVPFEKWYMSTDIGTTHTFITIRDNENEYVYPESSFSTIEGVHQFKTLDEVARYIALAMFKINNNKQFPKIKYHVFKYEGHPEYGSDMKTCTEYFTTGEPVCEGTVYRP